MNPIETKVIKTEVKRSELVRYSMLTFCGGFAGIYSYIMCDRIFANAQTGNLLNLMLAVKAGSPLQVILHIVPLILYILGITCTILLPNYLKNRNSSLSWEKCCLLIEAACMGIVCLLPMNISPILYISPIFFASALQYNTFRTCNGINLSTLFFTNNIRQLVISFWKNKLDKNKEEQFKMKIYGMVLLSFLLGGFSCLVLVEHFKQFTILVSSMILLGNCLFDDNLVVKISKLNDKNKVNDRPFQY
ncbi:YoaK family protein [Anaeromicropila herbilytica]|uniref:Membrane protein n=1 Tax=Anaeromicropila herbilytica TaxID=2785025 RepID=A0A7R7EJU5_9FIRM|nr:YoaK family protein [Anaeromicropila herbilytica]BCN30103.1 membrane protein [Anaeromicropila herbilytica]